MHDMHPRECSQRIFLHPPKHVTVGYSASYASASSLEWKGSRPRRVGEIQHQLSIRRKLGR